MKTGEQKVRVILCGRLEPGARGGLPFVKDLAQLQLSDRCIV